MNTTITLSIELAQETLLALTDREAALTRQEIDLFKNRANGNAAQAAIVAEQLARVRQAINTIQSAIEQAPLGEAVEAWLAVNDTNKIDEEAQHESDVALEGALREQGILAETDTVDSFAVDESDRAVCVVLESGDVLTIYPTGEVCR